MIINWSTYQVLKWTWVWNNKNKDTREPDPSLSFKKYLQTGSAAYTLSVLPVRSFSTVSMTRHFKMEWLTSNRSIRSSKIGASWFLGLIGRLAVISDGESHAPSPAEAMVSMTPSSRAALRTMGKAIVLTILSACKLTIFSSTSWSSLVEIGSAQVIKGNWRWFDIICWRIEK